MLNQGSFNGENVVSAAGRISGKILFPADKQPDFHHKIARIVCISETIEMLENVIEQQPVYFQLIF